MPKFQGVFFWCLKKYFLYFPSYNFFVALATLTLTIGRWQVFIYKTSCPASYIKLNGAIHKKEMNNICISDKKKQHGSILTHNPN